MTHLDNIKYLPQKTKKLKRNYPDSMKLLVLTDTDSINNPCYNHIISRKKEANIKSKGVKPPTSIYDQYKPRYIASYLGR